MESAPITFLEMQSAEVMDRLFALQAEAEKALVEAFYGPDPVMMSITPEGDIHYRKIPHEEFYEQPEPPIWLAPPRS